MRMGAEEKHTRAWTWLSSSTCSTSGANLNSLQAQHQGHGELEPAWHYILMHKDYILMHIGACHVACNLFSCSTVLSLVYRVEYAGLLFASIYSWRHRACLQTDLDQCLHSKKFNAPLFVPAIQGSQPPLTTLHSLRHWLPLMCGGA